MGRGLLTGLSDGSTSLRERFYAACTGSARRVTYVLLLKFFGNWSTTPESAGSGFESRAAHAVTRCFVVPLVVAEPGKRDSSGPGPECEDTDTYPPAARHGRERSVVGAVGGYEYG